MTPSGAAADQIQSDLQRHNAGRTVRTSAPRTLPELLAQHAQAALDLSGADQTAWNGQIIEAGDGILGLAHWDGSLHLDRACILEPLHDLYARSGEPRPSTTLARYRDALVTLLHEQSHFLGPHGATQEAARQAFSTPGAQALEEGVAEAWSHSHLDAYLDSLAIPHHAPGIEHVRTRPSYQSYVPATVALTNYLDRRASRPPGTALHLLNRQTTQGQWGLVTDLLYRSTTLPRVVPSAHEPEVRHHLESRLRGAFQSLDVLQVVPHELAEHRSVSIARDALTTLDQELERLHTAFGRLVPAPRERPDASLREHPARDADDDFELTR